VAAQAQREWFEKDYYKVLGVPESATEKEIRRAYRKLAKEHHPDANPGQEDRFKEISAAYDVLSDDEKRKSYDEVRRLGPMAGGFGPGPGSGGFGPRPGGGFTFTTDDLGDMGGLGDLFGNLFGGGGGGRRRGQSGPGPRRGDDLETELHLSFLDAVNGVTTTVNLTSEAACRTCNGSGAAPGTSPVVCTQCHGRGVIDDNQGPFSFSRACPRCSGRGTIVESPCPTCKGSGVERRPREVKVRIPAGVDDGQRIRLKGRGGAGRNGGPPGDLYVVVHVAAHELFKRKGRDLVLTVPVTFSEAALGAEIKVPTLDGGPVTLKVPAGTRSGRTFRVKGRGVPVSKGAGDLLVTTEVAVPAKLTPEQRDLVQALADATEESPRTHLGV
jgi:molecular chaperone DnaJ